MKFINWERKGNFKIRSVIIKISPEGNSLIMKLSPDQQKISVMRLFTNSKLSLVQL